MAGLNKQLKKDVSTKDQAMCLVLPNDRQDIDAKIKMALDAPQGRWYENDKQVKVLMIVFDPELEKRLFRKRKIKKTRSKRTTWFSISFSEREISSSPASRKRRSCRNCLVGSERFTWVFISNRCFYPSSFFN